MSISVLSDRLRDLEQHDRCHDACIEAADILAPFAARHPQAHGGLMQQILKDYLAACQALDKEPDIDLLGPLLSVLQASSAPAAFQPDDIDAITAALPEAIASLAPRIGALDAEFALPTILPGLTWIRPSREAALTLLARLDLATPDGTFTQTHEVAALRTTELPCYPGFELAEIAIASEPQRIATLLIAAAGVQPIGGTAQCLHALNAAGLLAVDTTEQASSYLRLFCDTVLANGHPFTIIDTIDDLDFVADPDNGDLVQLQELIAPLSLTHEESNWSAEATVLHAGALFRTTFHIHKDGRVDMVDDTPLAADLSVRPIQVEGIFRS